MTSLVANAGKVFGAALLGTWMFFISGCEKALDIKEPPSDPVAVFDELWNVMDQHYALFSIKGVNWKDAYQQYRVMVNDETTEKDLFKVLTNMLETLRDGHVTLMSGFDTATYENFYKAFPANFNLNNIVTNYLKNDYKTSGPVIYKLADNVGYIYYNSFSNDITPEQVDKIVSDMTSTKGLIIDVRNNTGGKLVNAEKIFSRFIKEKKLTKYELMKKGPGHDDFSEPKPFYCSPAGGQSYTNPVVVLTNRASFSACNDFVAYMSELPNVKLMGDQTGGGGSIPLHYVLANGWRIQYSSTMTLSPDKKSIESGILPDVNIGITPIDETNGKDPILEKAFFSLQ